MEYYAKSENLQGHQETVKEHLQKVAALARLSAGRKRIWLILQRFAGSSAPLFRPAHRMRASITTACRKIWRGCCARPSPAFMSAGRTGDGSRLTFAERCRTAELTIAQTRAAGRRTIVHVGQTLQRHALELASRLKRKRAREKLLWHNRSRKKAWSRLSAASALAQIRRWMRRR